MEKISIIIPCYNEEEAVPAFYDEISKVAEEMNILNFEFIFVDDGSTDKTLNVLKEFSEKDKRVKYISFSRNFGKESAIYAGMEKSTGEYVGIMDVDLQDPPKMLIKMYEGITKEGYDCVATRRITRKGEPIIRSFFAECFYKLINCISKVKIVSGARDFRLMKRNMADAVIKLCEYNRFSKGIFSWVGFKTKWLEYENVERTKGVTKWSFWKLFVYSLEGIMAFSTAPLAFASFMGVIFCMVSFMIAAFFAVRTLLFGNTTPGWTSLICVIFFIGGIQLFCMGILGQYLAKTYLETKKRAIYIIRESNTK